MALTKEKERGIWGHRPPDPDKADGRCCSEIQVRGKEQGGGRRRPVSLAGWVSGGEGVLLPGSKVRQVKT